MGLDLGHLGDFVGGFQDESSRIRTENQRSADRDQARSDSLFHALANSDDPDIRAAAVTGLLTGDHPATGMGKWFGKVSGHPAYEQIKGLVADGHQPFMDPTKRHAAEKSADLDAAIATAEGHGVSLSAADKRRMTMSAVGAAPPRGFASQPGTITHTDGTTEAGSFDPDTGQHYDQYGSVSDDVVSFTYHGQRGTGSPSTGGKWNVVKDATSPTGWTSVHIDAAGKELGRQVGVPPPASTLPSFVPAPQPGYGFNTKTNKYEASGGEPGAAAKPETSAQSAESLRAIEARIVQMHPAPKASQFIPVTKEAEAQHREQLDVEAKNYGYADFTALQEAIAKATGGVSNAVATPPPRPPVPQPKGTGRSNAGGTGGTGGTGGLNIDAIKKQLAKDHGGTATGR